MVSALYIIYILNNNIIYIYNALGNLGIKKSL